MGAAPGPGNEARGREQVSKGTNSHPQETFVMAGLTLFRRKRRKNAMGKREFFENFF